MTNKTETSRGRRPWKGMLLGGLDRLSSAGGKAVLDERLILPNGPLQVQHATFLEATFGGLFLLLRIYMPALLFWRKRRGTGTPERTERSARTRTLVLLTFLTIAGDKVLLVLALTSITFTIAGGIYYAIPLLVPVIWGFRRGTKGRAALLTLFAAAIAVGVFMLVQEDGTALGGDYLLGVACALGAGTSRTLFLPVTDRLIKGAGRVYTEKAIAWSVLSVGLAAGVVVAITGGLGSLLDWRVIAWAALVGLLNNTLPRIIQMPARELAGDAVYAVFLAASPVIATFVGVAFLGDRLHMVQWAGFVIIAVAAAAVAHMSLNLKDKGYAPLVELSSATPQARLTDAEHKLSQAKKRLEEMTLEIKALETRVAEAAVEVAETELAEAQSKAKQLQERAKVAMANSTKAEKAAADEWEKVQDYQERVRLARARMPAETS